jgi:hypothetical protein
MTNIKSQTIKNRPLMYIVQPDLNSVPISMQNTLIVKNPKKKNELEEEIPTEPKEELENVEEKNSLDVSEEVIQEELEKEEEKTIPEDPEVALAKRRESKKRLSTMSIVEKITFFVNLPENMPRALCQIVTKDTIYRGVILSEESGLVSIQSLTSPNPVKVKIEEIEAINVLGF